MDSPQKVNEDVNILFNITDILTQCLRYQQIYTYTYNLLSYLRDPLMCMRQVAIQTMDYINAAMTNILSPNLVPVEESRNMLRHIKSQLPSPMYLPISSDETFHFYQYLKTYVLTADRQYLLLINVPIQDRAQQLQIYEILNLIVPHSDISAQYKITNKYIEITYDDTQAVIITEQQHLTFLHANGQFCKIDASFQPLTNPPIMYSSLICQEWSRNGSTLFPINISHHLHLHLLQSHQTFGFSFQTPTSKHWM